MDPPPSPSSSLQPQIPAVQSATDRHESSTAAVEKPKKNKGKKKKLFKEGASVSSSSSFSASTSTLGFSVRGAPRVACKRRGQKVVVNAARRNPTSHDVGFRLGMSMALVVNQILERNGERGGAMSSDYLAKMCASAVRNSLANDFGNTFDCLIENFQQSFGSTLRTQKSIKESSEDSTGYISSKRKMEEYSPCVTHDEEDDCLRREDCGSSYITEDFHSREVTYTSAAEGRLNYREQLHQIMLPNPVNLEVALHGQTNQLTGIRRRTVGSVADQSMLDTYKHANELKERELCLKECELGISLKNLELKGERVAQCYDSNNLERLNIALGRSKASFKAEKFKTQLEDTRHSELLRKCIDCLVAGIFVMAAALFYGTYVYSYRRIREATASCTPSKDEKSWWNPVSSFNSRFQVLRCQAVAVSRMVFGLFMILVIAYLIFQRSADSKQTMPVTFIILMLGIACGWAGKFCVDTLGGSGYHWLIYWETLCILHFFCNVFTSVLFYILHGPVDVSPGTKGNLLFPYWIRRLVFYSVTFLFLPLFCGLLPFASLGEWMHHIFQNLKLFSDPSETGFHPEL
ncbi:protein CPR-5 [Argentina anserina]|uniref:protein CPR-5 n=1 Tax=Argentina anserina TaxID=57926 RepID=UPI002176608E|nr:protein CPR-5 [Potentilla anserina]